MLKCQNRLTLGVCVCFLPDLSVCALHTDVLRRDMLPLLCLLHHRLSVHQTEAVQVADCRKRCKVTADQTATIDDSTYFSYQSKLNEKRLFMGEIPKQHFAHATAKYNLK